MKGIVVDINKNDAVILSDGGLFTRVKNKNYAVGQTIQIQESKKTYPKLVAGAASMAAAFAVCTIGAYAWFTPTDYVSMDVNPSIEYTLNTFDRILDVEGVNDDGEEILAGLELKNMKIDKAVKATLDQLMAEGYLGNDPNGGVVITTSNDKKGDAEELAAELEQEVQAYLDGQDGITAEVDAEAVAPERVEEAKELGVTPGKLNLVEKLQASTTGAIHMDEWLNKPVKEINKAIKENRKNGKDAEEPAGELDREDSVTRSGIDTDRKPDKQEKERPNDNGRNTGEDGINENGQTDDRSDQTINEQKNNGQKTNQKTDSKKTDLVEDEDAPDNMKPPKDDSRQGGGNASGKGNGQDD